MSGTTITVGELERLVRRLPLWIVVYDEAGRPVLSSAAAGTAGGGGPRSGGQGHGVGCTVPVRLTDGRCFHVAWKVPEGADPDDVRIFDAILRAASSDLRNVRQAVEVLRLAMEIPSGEGVATEAAMGALDRVLACGQDLVMMMRMVVPGVQRPRKVDAARMLRLSADILRRIRHTHGDVEVVVEGGPVWMHIDPAELSRCFLKLLIHALEDHRAGGGRCLRVRGTVSASGLCVVLSHDGREIATTRGRLLRALSSFREVVVPRGGGAVVSVRAPVVDRRGIEITLTVPADPAGDGPSPQTMAEPLVTYVGRAEDGAALADAVGVEVACSASLEGTVAPLRAAVDPRPSVVVVDVGAAATEDDFDAGSASLAGLLSGGTAAVCLLAAGNLLPELRGQVRLLGALGAWIAAGREELASVVQSLLRLAGRGAWGTSGVLQPRIHEAS